MNSLKYVINEHANNWKTINTLAINEIKIFSAGTALGYWWTLVKDIIYFMAYSAFMLFLYGNTDMMGVPRLVFLVTALVPWYFISDCLSSGTSSVRKRAGILTKIKFPISIVPTYEILAIFYKRLASYLIVLVILAFYGYLGHFNILQFIYYTFCSIAFLVSFAMVISAFVAVSKDFAEFYSSLVRISFFFVPILWTFDTLKESPGILFILKLNPLLYLIDGMRSAFIFSNPIDVNYTIYFWVVTVLIFCLGCYVQNKMKRLYADFM